MDAINPYDIGNLDFDNISFITLKNGDIIMIDASVPIKYNSNDNKRKNSFTKKEPILKSLSVSKQLSFSYKGKINFNKYNNNSNKNKQIIIKNDFNLISRISKTINFCIKGKSNKMILNNIPILSFKENTKKISLNDYNSNDNINNKKEKSNPIVNSNPNSEENELDKIKENNNNIIENNNQILSLERNNLNIKPSQITEEEKLDLRIKRKSRNYLERLSLLFNEKNKPLVNAVISLKIPSDVKKKLSDTEKEFDMMVTQLKQKRSKYNMNRNEHSIYQRYYELYKDNNKEFKYINLNRIKYYHESENDNKENEPQINSNSENNNKLEINSVNNTFYGNFYNKGVNKSITGLTDTNVNNKTTRDNKSFSTRIKDLGYNSNLICPTNSFKDKLDSDF